MHVHDSAQDHDDIALRFCDSQMTPRLRPRFNRPLQCRYSLKEHAKTCICLIIHHQVTSFSMPKKKHYKRPKRPERSQEPQPEPESGEHDTQPISADESIDKNLGGGSTALVPAPATEQKADEYPPVQWYDVSTFGSSYTAGGDVELPSRIPVNDRVLNQEDKSLNKQLWSLYPADTPIETVWRQGPGLFAVVTDPIQPEALTLGALSTRLGSHATEQRVRLLVLTKVVSKELEDRGVVNRPPETRRGANYRDVLDVYVAPEIAEAKKRHEVSPILEAVAKLEAAKHGYTESAKIHSFIEKRIFLLGAILRTYMRLLLEIAPWHPYPDVLTAEQAFSSGVAQLHASLLYNCALVCFRVGHDDCRFLLRCLQFAVMLIETRFISHRLLIKTICLYRDAHYELSARGHIHHLSLGNPPKPHLDDIRKLIQRMEKKAANPDAWAHEHCLTAVHEGCM